MLKVLPKKEGISAEPADIVGIATFKKTKENGAIKIENLSYQLLLNLDSENSDYLAKI